MRLQRRLWIIGSLLGVGLLGWLGKSWVRAHQEANLEQEMELARKEGIALTADDIPAPSLPKEQNAAYLYAELGDTVNKIDEKTHYSAFRIDSLPEERVASLRKYPQVENLLDRAQNLPGCLVPVSEKDAYTNRPFLNGIRFAVLTRLAQAHEAYKGGDRAKASKYLAQARLGIQHVSRLPNFGAHYKVILCETDYERALLNLLDDFPAEETSRFVECEFQKLPPIGNWRSFLAYETITSLAQADYAAHYNETDESRRCGRYETATTLLYASLHGRDGLSERYRLLVIKDWRKIYQIARANISEAEAEKRLREVNPLLNDKEGDWNDFMRNSGLSGWDEYGVRPHPIFWLYDTHLQIGRRQVMNSILSTVRKQGKFFEDPENGQPLKKIWDGMGWVIYSVGINKQDDKGTRDDAVLLWPPHKRLSSSTLEAKAWTGQKYETFTRKTNGHFLNSRGEDLSQYRRVDRIHSAQVRNAPPTPVPQRSVPED